MNSAQWHDDHYHGDYRDLAPPMWGKPKRPNTITNKTKWKKKRRASK